ncbi:type II toxin-antitoxin system RelE/ParE family toxin [Chitinophaga filiformis]|uniref:Proteic killer suppression protein n=1 Tax=Chitinophaga filiformis TaxID=104663 RepID=A0A1G7Y4G4_CHIFI|nr:proteic killer suppression protein [Chitinophaga filiformis]
MILSFDCKDTKKVFEGTRVRKWSVEIQVVARRKLFMLNNAQDYQDLIVPPSNHFEKLKGKKYKGLCSIRINDQWRIVFKWKDGNASNVRIEDYHIS